MSLLHEIMNSVNNVSFQTIAQEQNIQPTQMENAFSTLSAGFLSAIKVKLSDQNEIGNIVSLFQGFMGSDSISDVFDQRIVDTLFSGNENVLSAIISKTSDQSGLDTQQVKGLLNPSANMFLKGLFSILEREGFSQLFGNNFEKMTDVVSGALNGNFQEAIDSANQFVGSVFAKQDVDWKEKNSLRSFLSFLDSDDNNQMIQDIMKMFAKESR